MGSEARGRKRKRFTGETVTIVVGQADDTETHTVHAGILEEHSAFWESALKKCWEEGAEGKIKLPEDDRDAVSTYLEWIYSSIVETTPLRNDEMSAKELDAEFEHLARVYVYGEKIQDNEFCNRTMDRILHRVTGLALFSDIVCCYPTTKAVKIIYDGTPEGSPARELCVWLQARIGLAEKVKSMEEGEHPDFLRDLTRAMMDVRGCSQHKLFVGRNSTWYKTV